MRTYLEAVVTYVYISWLLSPRSLDIAVLVKTEGKQSRENEVYV